jgi:hypothetical protein
MSAPRHLAILTSLVLSSAALRAEGPLQPASASLHASPVEAAASVVNATDLPTGRRGYALVLSLLALAAAFQQAYFSRRPRRPAPVAAERE